MKRALTLIQKKLSLKLGLSISLVVAFIFIASSSILFVLIKDYVRQAAILRATQILDDTSLHITAILKEVETATDEAALKLANGMTPDIIVKETRERLYQNPHFYSCSISMEPNYFKEYGKYYSIYSVKTGDSIFTARYGADNFSYFDLDWYKKPKDLKRGCWIDPFFNVNPESVYTPELITSYSRPLYDLNGRFVGVMAIDLQLKWFSQTVTSVEPYPNSSSIIIGREGNYFVHPDTTKLMKETIFSDADPKAREDVIPLGNDMIAGKSGMRQLVVDGQNAFIFYRPIGHEGWSTAIVCPESDVFSGYNQLLHTVWIIIVIGLLVIMVFCYQAIRKSLVPLTVLESQAHHIAAGHFDDILPRTKRTDTIGQLQNNFVQMQYSLVAYLNKMSRVNRDLEQRNQELVTANEQANEANKKTTEFVQDMMHQIRTPLNIISGFIQVIHENFHELPEEETKNIISMMQDNAWKISRIARLLVATSEVNDGSMPRKMEAVNCKELCQEVIASFQPTNPLLVKVTTDIQVADDLTIRSSKERVRDILIEMLDNANKFTHQGSITLACYQGDNGTINFSVSDTGIGIAECDRERIFTQFTKVSYFTEGIGLGLSMSKQTAQRLGGDLLIDTSYQGGSRFVLTLKTT